MSCCTLCFTGMFYYKLEKCTCNCCAVQNTIDKVTIKRLQHVDALQHDKYKAVTVILTIFMYLNASHISVVTCQNRNT